MSDEIRHAFATSAQLSPAPVPTIYGAAENLGGPASLGNDHQKSFALQPSARILSVVVPSGLWPHVEKRIGRPWTNARTLLMRIDIMFPQNLRSTHVYFFSCKREKTAVGQIVATDRGIEGVSDLAIVGRRAGLGLGLPRHVIHLEVVDALRRHPTRVVFLVAFHAKAAATRRDVQHAMGVKGSPGEKDRWQAVWLTCR